MDRPQTQQPMLLTRDAAAAALSVSEKTVRRLTDKGQLPIVRIGGRGVRYAVAALEAYIAANTIMTSPAAVSAPATKQGG